MQITDLNGKTICLLGFGREGQASLRAIEQYAPEAEVTIADGNEKCEMSNEKLHFQCGDDYLKDLDRFDIIIKSPGIPPQPELEAVADKVTNSTQIFLETVQAAGALVVGVTGSKGKSTTSALLAKILQDAGKDAHLVGNIGIPAFDYLDKANLNTSSGERSRTIFVQEMSSFQLLNLSMSPSVAIITSIFPEHLDYHGTMEHYLNAKAHICEFQDESGAVYYNNKFPECRELAERSAGEAIPFSDAGGPVAIENTKLLGKHNQGNIAAAYLVAQRLGVHPDQAVETIKQFEGLPHRLQSLGVHHGIEWVDDAISTTPESAIAALDALGDRVQTIILGGQDRGSDFTKLVDRILESKVQTVILLPESGERIGILLNEKFKGQRPNANSMTEVVQLALEHTITDQSEEPPICLLSTASPSYNMFKNFEEKGEEFKRQILVALP